MGCTGSVSTRSKNRNYNVTPPKKKKHQALLCHWASSWAFGIVGLGARSTLQPGLEVEPMDLLRLRVTQNPETRHVKALYTKRSQP